MVLVDTAPHEIEGHFQFTDHGLSPYWALGALLFDGHGGDCADLEVDLGEDTWIVNVYDADGGGIKPGGPAANVGADATNEYHTNCRGPDHEKLHFNIASRWEGMRSTSGDRIQTPFDRESWPDEGVDVDWSASNVEPEQVLAALPQVLRAITPVIRW